MRPRGLPWTGQAAAATAAIRGVIGRAPASMAHGGGSWPPGAFWTLAAIVGAMWAAVATSNWASAIASGLLRPLPRMLQGCGACVDGLSDETSASIARCQLSSDFLIALSYFSIPLELTYFYVRSRLLPFRWILVLFAAFIVLCGMTHIWAIFTYGPHAYGTALTLTVLKVATAVVSLATAIVLFHIIPTLLQVKVREMFLQHKAAALDREVGLMRTVEHAGRHVRLLTHEIRQTLDRHTILNTTLVQLAQALGLANCTIWMPVAGGTELELTHELQRRLVQVPVVVPAGDEVVCKVVRSNRAVEIDPACALGIASSPRGAVPGSTMAVRLPLLQASNFCYSRSQELAAAKDAVEAAEEAKYAVLVLVLPPPPAGSGPLRTGARNRWRRFELEMVEVVADQVAVALSHAAVLEEAQRTRDHLAAKNQALQEERAKAQTAVAARNGFLTVMNCEMRTPLARVVALASLLEASPLNDWQAMMVSTITAGSLLVDSLTRDVMEVACSPPAEEASLLLRERPFDLHELFAEVRSMVRPIARARGHDLSVRVGPGVPPFVRGDPQRLLQTALGIASQAVQLAMEASRQIVLPVVGLLTSLRRSCRPGCVTMTLTAESAPAVDLANGFGNNKPPVFLLRVEVRHSGPMSQVELANNYMESDGRSAETDYFRDEHSSGVLSLSNRIVQLMRGEIWARTADGGQGCVTTFTTLLLLEDVRPLRAPALVDSVYSQVLVGGRVLVTDENSLNRRMMQQMLKRLGCFPRGVASGEAALAELARGGGGEGSGNRGRRVWDVVLLDLAAPGMDGLEVARRAAALPAAAERGGLPLLVAVSTEWGASARDRALRAGMDAHLTKPLSLAQLGAALVKLVRRQQQRGVGGGSSGGSSEGHSCHGDHMGGYSDISCW
eukprot:SM000104S09323  [mRNA]  locus=s104:80251:85361:- [translate_table: standard]